MLPPVKMHLLFLILKSLIQYLFSTVFACKWYQVYAHFSPDSNEMTFSLEKALLWIEDKYFGLKQQFEVKICLNDGFVSYKHAVFTLQNINVPIFWTMKGSYFGFGTTGWHACRVKKHFHCRVMCIYFYLTCWTTPKRFAQLYIFPNPSFVWR